MADASVPSLPVHLTKRIRSACDRCHSQKLKCRKLSSSGQCARCMKAQRSCVFSPANRGFRANPEAEIVPQGGGGTSSASSDDTDSPLEVQDISTTTQNLDNGYTNAFGAIGNDDEPNTFNGFEAWNLDEPPMYLPELNEFQMGNLDFSLAQGISQTNPYFCSSSGGLMNFPPTTPPNSSVTPFMTAGLYMQRLSSLSMDLYNHAATLPAPDWLPTADWIGVGDTACKEFEIDQTFSHTETLLHIINEIFPRSPVSSPFPFHSTYNHISDLDDQSQCRHLVLDPATMLLLLSCCIRLIDIYDRLFDHTRACIKNLPECDHQIPRHNRYDQMPRHNKSNIPMQVVKVGSYSVESGMTAGLAVLHIFLSMSRQLLGRMSGIASIMGFSDGRGEFVSKTGHAEITESAFKSADKRTREATRNFEQVRTELFQLGIL